MQFTVNDVVSSINGILFHEYVVYVLLLTGVLFTFWSAFGQYRALTHGVSVIKGKYDKADDPGAITHFQALSAALSATVGLGNIAGVAIAVALGGPGAIFWMWVIGILGMALKMTEVTQSMLTRDTSDPKNPHGGPMYVVDNLFKSSRIPFGATIGGIFCFTLILSAFAGGNMFQAWNVADVTTQYFDFPVLSGMEKSEGGFDPETFAIGVILALIVGSVIIGGIRRIGAVAGTLVPFMCVIYLLAGFLVLILNITEIPALIVLIVKHGLGLGEASASGAFLGGTFGYAMMWGIKRALFSSEAGQGSAPIAHAAAKCDEPVREGVVAGLEPFIDTLVVCTVTALIILATGTWNRSPEADFGEESAITLSLEDDMWKLATPTLPNKNEEAKRIGLVAKEESGWSAKDKVFMMARAHEDENTNQNLHKIEGRVVKQEDGSLGVKWDDFKAKYDEEGNVVPVTIEHGGVWENYSGASLTARAFDTAIPGLGKWLIVIASWLFAISTMISWSYYGEKGVVFLYSKIVGKTGDSSSIITITLYRLVYTALVAVSTMGFIQTDKELDMWTTLGLGAMLVVNIPIMWIYGPKAMQAYHTYIGKLKRGEFDS